MGLKDNMAQPQVSVLCNVALEPFRRRAARNKIIHHPAAASHFATTCPIVIALPNSTSPFYVVNTVTGTSSKDSDVGQTPALWMIEVGPRSPKPLPHVHDRGVVMISTRHRS